MKSIRHILVSADFSPSANRAFAFALRQKLHDLYAREAGADGAVDIFIAKEPAPEAILSLAEETGADLIVMATHGRTGLKRALSGIVADAIVPKAACPVLTIPIKKLASEERT